MLKELEKDGIWHRAINQYHDKKNIKEFCHWMYEAKAMFYEIPRLTKLFARERKGELPQIHQQCSYSKPEGIKDNHLSCCLGVECRKCPQLLALEKIDLPDDEIDEIKAYTCSVHILMTAGKHKNSVDTSEGFILTEGDRMYWQSVYSSLSGGEI